MSFTPVAIGMVASVGVAVFARLVGFDRDRSFYPTVMIVIAAYYVLFAIMSGSVATIAAESVLTTGFVAVAVIGFRRNEWLVAGALAAHGVMDIFHHHLVENTGVPRWWPAWCATYDLGAAVCLGWLIRRRAIDAAVSRSQPTGN